MTSINQHFKVAQSVRGALLGSALALCPLAGAHAQSTPFDSITVFGDSLSDPGNLAAFGAAPPPPYFEGQFSNGPVWAVVFPGLSGVPSAGNFAFGGATTGAGPIDLQTQVASYLATSPQAGADDLFSIWIGANDYFSVAATLASDPTADLTALASAAVAETVGNIAASLATLNAGAGAERFVLFNLPNLGQTPFLNADPSLAIGGAQISALHNNTLAATAGQLAREQGYDITLVDIETLFTDASRNPSKYGFTNTTDACLDGVTLCSLDPDEQNGFLFWDDVHPTALGHAITAAYALDTLTAPQTLAAQGETGMALTERLQARLSDLSAGVFALPEGEADGFVEIGGADAERDGERTTTGYESETLELSAGVVGRFDASSGGVGLLTLSQTEVDLADARGGFDVMTLSVAGVLTRTYGGLTASAGAGASVMQFDDIERVTGVADQIAEGSTSAFGLNAFLEGRYDLGGETVGVAPLARLTANFLDLNKYQESGAVGLNQLVQGRDIDSVSGEFGAQLRARTQNISLRAEGVWVEAIDEEEHAIDTSLVTVTDLVRTLDAAGRDGSYARISVGAGVDLGGFGLEIGGRAVVDREESDAFDAYARLARRF